MEIGQTPTLSPENDNSGSGSTTPSPEQNTQSSALVSCVGGLYWYDLYYRPMNPAKHLTGELKTRVCFQILMLPVGDTDPVTQWDTELGSGLLLNVQNLSTNNILVPITSDYMAGSIVDNNGKTYGITGGHLTANIKFMPPAQPDDKKIGKVFFFKCDPNMVNGVGADYTAMFHNLSNLARFSPATYKIRVDVSDVVWNESFLLPVNYTDDGSGSLNRQSTTSGLYTQSANQNFSVVRDYATKYIMGTTYKFVNRVSSINTQSIATNGQSIKVGGN